LSKKIQADSGEIFHVFASFRIKIDKRSYLLCLFSWLQTFCVVSKRFRKNYIHRFTATSSFFFFSPFSSVRKACIYLCTNQYFDYLVMATILLNCVFLAMAETIEEAE
jgi:tellurite resistance protein TehA-like permease